MSLLIFFIISLVFFGSTYFATTSLIPSWVVFVISLCLFMFFSNKKMKEYALITNRFHSCYRFINNLIISLSVKHTLSGALESVITSMDEDFIKEYQELSHLNDFEKIEYLKKYYRFHIYNLFVDIINLYLEQGGNILTMASEVIDKSRLIEEYLKNTHTIGTRKMVEFAVLWIFSILILLVLRFVLADFYSLIASKLFFQVAVVALILFIAVSIHIFVSRFTKIKLGGWSYEKV